MPRPFFHKLILPSNLQHKKLRIPDDFVKRFKDELSVAAALTVPDGHVSRVGLKKDDNKIWFQEGWQEFVERYSIRVGYFLIFRYEGNSAFSVSIFNLASSEIFYHSNTFSAGHGRQYPYEELEDEDYISPALQNLFVESKPRSILNWSVDGNQHAAKSVEKQSTQYVAVNLNTFEIKNTGNEVKLHSPEEETPKPKKRGRKKKNPDPYEQNSSAKTEDEAEMRSKFYESATARKRPATAEERERAINAAKTFEPVNPFCRVVLRPSYLYRGCIMYLPSCFAEKYLSGVSGFIKLQLPDGKHWPVRCLSKAGKAKFSQGWYEFTVENNLGEGDVCVFEMLKTREFMLKVTIFRVNTEGTEVMSMNQP